MSTIFCLILFWTFIGRANYLGLISKGLINCGFSSNDNFCLSNSVLYQSHSFSRFSKALFKCLIAVLEVLASLFTGGDGGVSK